ncbi:hypothetical protein DVA86_19215 [Streptomyces armeniacus]|uniref:Uncharacterized protein n=2 Tax=Streptomyces armeniacus TaxID=83291 RepID=A0A345XS39_9ACTN|nr:hypothetical protein DVA86_19215 [Streptomyces armeniacus]
MTEALLLTGLAVSVLSGCVTASGRPEPDGVRGPGHAPGAPPVDGAAARTVRPPLPREGLSRPEPARSRAASPAARTPSGGPEHAPAPGTRTPAAPAAGAAPAPARDAPEGRAPDRAPERPPGRPQGPRPGPAAQPARGGGGGPGPGVCDLGERYGRWDPDSTQARICRGAYGR